MFAAIGPNEYINLDQIARAEFRDDGTKYVGTIYFAKPGGSDRHFVYDEAAHNLEAAMKGESKRKKQ